MSKTRYVITNPTAFKAMLKSLEYQYADHPTFQIALDRYNKKNNVDLIASLLSPYELELGGIAVNYHGEILPAKGQQLTNISIFKHSPNPLDAVDNNKLTPEETLKILDFN